MEWCSLGEGQSTLQLISGGYLWINGEGELSSKLGKMRHQTLWLAVYAMPALHKLLRLSMKIVWLIPDELYNNHTNQHSHANFCTIIIMFSECLIIISTHLWFFWTMLVVYQELINHVFKRRSWAFHVAGFYLRQLYTVGLYYRLFK